MAGRVARLSQPGRISRTANTEGRTKVLHIITGLNPGGAETMLYRLISRTDRNKFMVEVISLIDIGSIGQKILALNVPVRTLGMRPGVANPAALFRLVRWLRRDPPDIIQTWMYHADLIGGLAAKLAGSIPVAWGVRHSDFDPRGTKRLTLWTALACARLSRRLPRLIVCCSEASRRTHKQMGYATDRMVVIPNGFDLEELRPDPAARRGLRQELGIPERAPLIGLIARFHPQKDHRSFVRAAGILRAQAPDTHFLLCGHGITRENADLAGWLNEAGISSDCHLLGTRPDIPRILAALDIGSSSAAHGEGFPNVVGEAMACGVPCVVTDVGDSSIIVGDTGVVVPPGDPHALANGWKRLLLSMSQEARLKLGLAARERIKENYGIGKIAERYESLHASLAA